MNQSQLQRIRTMEQAWNDVTAAADALQTAMNGYAAILPKLQALEKYYESPLWLQDYDDAKAGRLPTDLCRGILAEDTLYDLLCSHSHLQQELRDLSKAMGKTE